MTAAGCIMETDMLTFSPVESPAERLFQGGVPFFPFFSFSVSFFSPSFFLFSTFSRTLPQTLSPIDDDRTMLRYSIC